MKIAVVILNWNGKKLLEQFLPSVVQNSSEADVYLADNNSSDDSISYITTHFPSVQIIKNEYNFGFAQGYNEALKSVDADIFALVNSDVEVTQNWLQPIIETFKNEPNTAIVQPKILDYKRKDYFEYAGAGGGFIDQYGYPYCRGRVFETIEKDWGQYNDACEIFWASGACFFIRSSVYSELNGFDGDFFAHQEEIDLCWRAKNKKYTIKYNGLSTIYHVGGATLNEESPKKTFLNFRNSLFMLTKNLPKHELFRIVFFRMVLDGIAGIRFLFQGKFTHLFAVLKAHFHYYHLINRNLNKRSDFQLKSYFKINSIVYNYFIKKRHNF
ncbi:MAG: glycosyltransferase family 2 protein [Flavobacterium sp.]|jgi:GT2 family glycosyltransferase|nr:glycosyltransferase family 2 protein [Flavobacterium sp.]